MNYYRTNDETKIAAKKAANENSDTILEYGSAECDCGESFAIRLIDMNSLNTLEVFVECEACANQY